MKHRLMIKEHLDTKMKYLCYSRRDDYDVYQGSGTYWKRHLRKHGVNIKTTVIGCYDTKEELSERGRFYSELYNVVESPDWANLRPEEGDGTPVGARWKVKDTSNFGHTNQWINDDGTRSENQRRHLTTNNPMFNPVAKAKSVQTRIDNMSYKTGSDNASSVGVTVIMADGMAFIFPTCKTLCKAMKLNSAEVSTYLSHPNKQRTQIEMIIKQLRGATRGPSHRGYIIRKTNE